MLPSRFFLICGFYLSLSGWTLLTHFRSHDPFLQIAQPKTANIKLVDTVISSGMETEIFWTYSHITDHCFHAVGYWWVCLARLREIDPWERVESKYISQIAISFAVRLWHSNEQDLVYVHHHNKTKRTTNYKSLHPVTALRSSQYLCLPKIRGTYSKNLHWSLKFQTNNYFLFCQRLNAYF